MTRNAQHAGRPPPLTAARPTRVPPTPRPVAAGRGSSGPPGRRLPRGPDVLHGLPVGQPLHQLLPPSGNRGGRRLRGTSPGRRGRADGNYVACDGPSGQGTCVGRGPASPGRGRARLRVRRPHVLQRVLRPHGGGADCPRGECPDDLRDGRPEPPIQLKDRDSLPELVNGPGGATSYPAAVGHPSSWTEPPDQLEDHGFRSRG